MDQRSTLPPAMMKFLTKAAPPLNIELRPALETIFDGFITCPKALRAALANLQKQGKVPDMKAVEAALAEYLVMPKDEVAEEEAATPARTIKATRTARASTPVKPASGDDVGEAKPVSFTVGNGDAVPVKNWQQVMLRLVEITIDAGKEAEIPTAYFRSEPSVPRPLEKRIKNGQLVYTNLKQDAQVARARALAVILGEAVIVTAADGSQIPL